MDNEMINEDELCAACEAILFSMGDAVEAVHIAQALEVSIETIENILTKLMDKYNNADRGIMLTMIDGAYQLCTKKEMYDYLIKIAHVPKPKEITEVMLETLSIIAYKQPVTRLEVERIRGVNSDHTINKLVEYNLICEVGRKDAPDVRYCLPLPRNSLEASELNLQRSCLSLTLMFMRS